MPAGRANRLRGQRTRAAQHGGGVARGRARRSVRTLTLRAREIAGGGLRRTRRGRRHHARRLRHDLALGLQRRRARRRLAGFLDAQPNARRHEAAGLFANRFGRLARLGGSAGSAGVGSATGAAASAAGAAAIGASTGGASAGGVFDRRRRRLFHLGRFGRPRLLDQARRSERRRGRLGRLGRGCGRALLARRGLALRRGLDAPAPRRRRPSAG